MAGVFTSRPALDLLWGYEDPLLQLLVTLLPPGSLADGAKVCVLDLGLLGFWGYYQGVSPIWCQNGRSGLP